MKHKILILLFIFANATEDTIEKINLGDKPLEINIEIPSAIPDSRKEESNVLKKSQISAIKIKAKDYIPSSITQNDIIIIDTNKGTMKLKFYNDVAPNHCYNFKKLANSGFYDGTLFHRVIPGFMIQGGDILSRDTNPDNDGMGSPGWIVNAEFNNIKHERGVLSMARSRDINSAGSQFFICLDNAKHLDGKYTVFGYLYQGDHVLTAITNIGSEHDQGINLTTTIIPEGEDITRWVEVIDPKTRKVRYGKLPEYMNDKLSYKESLQKKLDNTSRPGVPIIIDSIRVVQHVKK